VDETVVTAVKSRRVGRKPKNPLPERGTVQITLRIPVEIVRELDAEVERIADKNFGAKVERNEIIRSMIIEALKHRSRSAKRGKK
jgi:hypothetical protein